MSAMPQPRLWGRYNWRLDRLAPCYAEKVENLSLKQSTDVVGGGLRVTDCG